jgi:proteasome lid subunit RPN8/RPN11
MSDHGFAIEILRDDAVLASVPASTAACIEDACFRAVLGGRVANDGRFPALTVTPVWTGAGPPEVAAVEVVGLPGAPAVYDLGVFAARARLLLAELVRDGQLESAAGAAWRVTATVATAEPRPRFRACTTRGPYPLAPAALPDVAPDTLAVTLDAAVLREVRAAVVEAGATECAGLLTGRLLHDAARAAARLEVTGQVPVPAGAGGASWTHFAFGPNTFAAARAALAGRTDGTIAAGWHHSHPPCAECPRHPDCTNDRVFLSADDCAVHASAFSAPYLVALVAGKVRDRPARDPGFRLYGWSGGTVAEVKLATAKGDPA